jgi:hypothetical protein
VNRVNRLLLLIACTLSCFIISCLGIFSFMLFCVFIGHWLCIPFFILFVVLFWKTYLATCNNKYDKKFYINTVGFISKYDLDFGKYYKFLCKKYKYIWILYIASINAGKRKPLKQLIGYYFLNKKQSRLDKNTNNVII